MIYGVPPHLGRRRSADRVPNCRRQHPDDVTHIGTWDELVRLVGAPSFLYVADSKLCSSEAMRHIDAKHGRFVTVIPHGRKEDTFFKDWVQTAQT